jgi:hypothetical protein
MPAPRRRIVIQVSDLAPLKHGNKTQRPEPANTIKRCGRCKCLLARDQDNHMCSPCQRGFSDTPEAVVDYLE